MDRSPEKLKLLAPPLLAWYDENRRILPWREEVSAYRTWVSEIMLQQTRVSAVLPYFQRFMDAFPTVEDLAAADTEQLMKLWEGLGYYSRARNLQKAARIVAEDCGGRFPQTYEDLIALPGIGDYTAGAILSIAFGQRIPAVDGNVLRLAARITGSRLDVLESANRKRFRQWMADALPETRCGAFNQALMDLGATVCLPNGAPLCHLCPAQDFCTARAEGCQQALPVRQKKARRRTEEKTVFLLLRGGETALRQRPGEGLLGGLWEYPHVPGTLDEPQAAAQLAQWGIVPHRWVKTIHFRHIFTHIEWKMTGYILQVQGTGPDGWVWADAAARAQLAVPSAFEKLTREIAENGTALL
jgi:A/G-specific adenine glycosylase